MRTLQLAVAIPALLGAFGTLQAHAERLTCWQTQTSQILAHTASQTTGSFEVSGATRDDQHGVLKYQCNGTFLLSAEGKQYSYLCELMDAAGESFSLQNSGAHFGAAEYIRGAGTGKYAERLGVAADYEHFPMNRDGGLPSCDTIKSALSLP